MTGETLWITGARGFIGRALAQARAAAGDTVHGVGHGDVAAPPPPGLVSWTSGDLEPGVLDEMRRRHGTPDVIYHLAGGASVRVAEVDPDSDRRRTVDASAMLLDWVADSAPASRVVMISSAAVYGEAGVDPIAESVALKPVSVYGRHKALMEDLARRHAARGGRPVAIARLFSIYGPGLRKQLLWDLSTRLAADPEVLELGGGGQELRDWTTVADVCAALPRIAAAAGPDCPAVNVGVGVGISVKHVAGLVLEAWRSKARLVFSGVSPPGDPFSLVADPARLAALGHLCQEPVDQGVAAYVAWSRGALLGGAASGAP